MNYYRTIKELVIETSMAEGQFPSYEKLTALVRQHFPTSKWQKTHYALYKSKIKTGEISVPGLPAESFAPSNNDGIEAEVEESIEASVSLERDLHSYLATRVNEIESGLTLVENGVECQTDAGRIDLLARDANNHLVVVELKAGKAKDADMYDIDGARVNIMYVRKPCQLGLPADWGNWNVPPYTVVNISVEIIHEKWFPIRDLGIPDIEKMKWYTDDANFTYYHDKKNGVQYEVRNGMVRGIAYGPTENDQSLLCRKDVPVIKY